MSPTFRNAPCPCGSGRRFRHCCMKREEEPPAAPVPAAPESSPPAAPPSEPAPSRVPAWAFKVLFAALAVLYFFALRSYFVGYFNDDAFYLIGAKSLLQGRYAQLHAPLEAPLVQYMPGYPLLLAPIVALFGSASIALQLFSNLMVLSSFLLLERLWRGVLSDRARFAALALFGASPIAISLSGTVVAEVPYLLWTAVVFTVLARTWERRDARTWLLVGALAGYGALLRPNGVCLPASAALALFLSRRRRDAALCLLAGLAPVGVFCLRNMHYAGIGSSYFGELLSPFLEGRTGAAAAAWMLLAGNALFYLKVLFLRCFLDWPARLQDSPLGWASILFALAAAVKGSHREGEEGWERVMRLHLLLYFAVLFVWFKPSPRYLLPVLPYAFAFVVRGLEAWGRRLAPRGGAVVWAALAAGLLLCVPVNLRNLKASLFWRSSYNTPPMNTYSWIRENTSENAVFAAELQGQLYLYTRRKGWRLQKPRTPQELALWAWKARVDYILSAFTGTLMTTLTGTPRGEALSQLELEGLLAGAPGVFERVFSDNLERMAVYRVHPPLPPPYAVRSSSKNRPWTPRLQNRP